MLTKFIACCINSSQGSVSTGEKCNGRRARRACAGSYNNKGKEVCGNDRSYFYRANRFANECKSTHRGLFFHRHAYYKSSSLQNLWDRGGGGEPSGKCKLMAIEWGAGHRSSQLLTLFRAELNKWISCGAINWPFRLPLRVQPSIGLFFYHIVTPLCK